MTGLAVASICLVLYTYAGYPLLVAAWARVAPRRWRGRDDFEPTVSVCIAVHDGERYLAAKLRSLQELDYPREKLDILLCSDGSTDGTEPVARALAEGDPRITVLATERRAGKPNALNELGKRARGEVLLMTDVRQSLSANAVRELVRPLADPQVGCVSGTLVLAGATGPSAYWRYERFIRGSESRVGGMVGVSGSPYALRRADFGELPRDVLLDDMWVPLSVARTAKSIVLAEHALAFDDACDDDREFGRKVRTLAGNYQLIAKMPWLLVPLKNPLWFPLFSHKLCRLLCPWALLGAFVATAALTADTMLGARALTFWRAAFVGQLAFYALALLGERAGRLGSLARTFVVLNVAAVVGLWRFARGTQAVTW
ncbi:MAG TPA: glycosyltransferase family 2 protein [Polyangiaceae bacterium]|jgi:cellulose synthase/poly-beta-1,6-N-acetylglucosamine synthase-like glycosyltransferase|nr:glycosyltransferase family 2 protein [Polyangiaceae bacterium]